MNTSVAPIPVAIVGCGVIGAHHARVLSMHPRFEVVALVDAVDGAAEKLATTIQGQFSTPPLTTTQSLADAVDAAAFDLVVICTPSGLHVSIAEEALTAGKHIVIEKPLDVDLVRGRRIAELAGDAAARGIVASVISQHRFDPGVAFVARSIAAGRLGTLTSGVALSPWWRSQEYYDSGRWRGTWALDGGGALMNQGVHTLDTLISLMGRPTEIFAQTALLAHDGIEVEDVAVATLRFESGALAVLNATTAGYPGLGSRVQVQGTRGSAVITKNELSYFHALDEAEDADPTDVADRSARQFDGALPSAGEPDDPFLAGHYRQYDDIAEALDTGRQVGVSVDDAFTTLACVVAVYASASLGAAVLLDDVIAGRYDDVDLTVGPRVGPSDSRDS